MNPSGYYPSMRAILFLFALATATTTHAISDNQLVIGCSIFDHNGKLLERHSGWICGFFSNGSRLVGDGFTLNFYSPDDELVWSKDIHTHHSFVRSLDDETMLVTGSVLLNENTRIDTLHIYDSQGNLKKYFRLPVIKELPAQPFKYDNWVLPRVSTEMGQIVSFHKIGGNRSPLTFLRQGNYVAASNRGNLFFLNSSLNKIVATLDLFSPERRLVADVQITPEGSALLFSHGGESLPESSLEEIDLTSRKVLLRIPAKVEGRSSARYEGSVQRLASGQYLHSLVDGGFEGPQYSIFVAKDGRQTKVIRNDGSNLMGRPNTVRQEPLDSYFRNRGKKTNLQMRAYTMREELRDRDTAFQDAQFTSHDMIRNMLNLPETTVKQAIYLYENAIEKCQDDKREILKILTKEQRSNSDTARAISINNQCITRQLHSMETIASLLKKGDYPNEQLIRGFLRQHRMTLNGPKHVFGHPVARHKTP